MVITMLALLIAGCARPDTTGPAEPPSPEVSSPGTPPTTPPEIPPVSSFFMDFRDFLQKDSTSLYPDTLTPQFQQMSYVSTGSDHLLTSGANDIGKRKNWGFAAFNVGFWSALVVVGLAVPVASFLESFKHTPVQETDYRWIWSYEVTVRDSTYNAELHGKYIEQGVRWDMYISKQNEYDGFHWYRGESNLPATEGFWILKNKPSEPTDLLRIDWQRDLAEGTGDIRYINIVPDGPENGGYIHHGTTSKEPYNLFYDIYNKGKDNHTYIQWNKETTAGRVKDSNHFDDNDWHCWDSDHLDVECP
jgi:hypothetical protein